MSLIVLSRLSLIACFEAVRDGGAGGIIARVARVYKPATLEQN